MRSWRHLALHRRSDLATACPHLLEQKQARLIAAIDVEIV